jgi:hypothetical protein
MAWRPSCWFFITANSAFSALRLQAVPAFAVPAKYTYGNGSRNILTQDDLIEWDFSLTKVFHLGEQRSLEIRGEAFNTFNRTTFGAPSANIDQSSGATVGNTFVAPRELELAAKLFF